ncbi:FAD-dependent oxidoreductase [Candidatus Sororendozoicomonas aggregata]|uniref:FAD-dependent oxidoreductase n=1 Tax=Candidatus Sororendozoicomonas aggregata TaxID=3073239 RepID=UPI002ED50EA4
MESFRPYWYDQALKEEGEPQANPLTEEISADVCIIGGGYTGLWTAILLKDQQPELNIVIIEQKLCGYGASGCNGGCVLTLATKYLSLKKFYGEAEARRLVLASEAAVGKIKDFTEQYDIDCDLRIDGALYIATNQSQLGAMDPVMAALDEKGINSWRNTPLDQAQVFAATDEIFEAFFSPKAGSAQPAKLVRGLARVAREKGIRIYEGTPMKNIVESHPPTVITEKGSITAKKVVVAINAWMAGKYKKFERTMAVVSSDMGITEPVPEILEELKLHHGAAICDSRIFVHYFHTTSDGRILLGKGGNTFAFGSKMIPAFFKASKYRDQVKNALVRFYPKLKDVKIEQSWTGGSDRTTTGFPIFGNFNGNPNIHYGFGYSGNGVVQTYLGGQILTSLCLNRDDQWSNAGFVGGPLGKFPPEPIRWLGAMTVRNAIRRKENAEDANKKPGKINNYLATFAKAAGKADK